jgi:hypothetical protein
MLFTTAEERKLHPNREGLDAKFQNFRTNNHGRKKT